MQIPYIITQIDISLHISLSILLKERPYYKDLKATQCNDENGLDYTEPDDPWLCTSNGGEVSVFAGAEVLLRSCCHQHCPRL